MNLGLAKKRAIQLIKEYSESGTLIPDSTNADYLLPANSFADMAQKELATITKIHASKQITQNPIPSQLGLLQGFDILQHLSTDLTMSAKGSRAYYFEVDRQATIYVEEETSPGVWAVLSTITVPDTVTSFTAYKGLINPSNVTNNVRARFSGNYPYNIRNRALYAYTFPTANDVPIYRPYIKYDMPVDFMELNKVIQETDPRQYVNMKAYYWEGKRTFVCNYYETGSFTIQYFRYPTTINETTLDTHEFEIDTEAQELIPFFIASKMLFKEEDAASVQLLNEYEVKKSNLGTRTVSGSNYVNNNLYSL